MISSAAATMRSAFSAASLPRSRFVERGGLLEDRHAADDGRRHAVVADREVVERALGLRPPVPVVGDLDRPHAVGLGAGRAGGLVGHDAKGSAPLSPFLARKTAHSAVQRAKKLRSRERGSAGCAADGAVHRAAEVGAEQAGGAGQRGGLDVGGDDETVALDALHDRGRDRSGGPRLDARRDARRGRAASARSRARSPGVSVSGGYAHATTIPCGRSSDRSVSASPRTANFTGAYALYPYTPRKPTVDETSRR